MSASETSGASPRRSEECLSDLALDNLVATSNDARPPHLEQCARCQARLAMFEQHQQLAHLKVSTLLDRAERVAEKTAPSRRGAWAMASAVLVAGAAVLLLTLTPRPEPQTEDLRMKGSAIRFFVQHDGVTKPGHSGDVFAPGDKLRFLVSTGSDGYFFLVGIEASGKVSAYHPFDGVESVKIPSGVDQALPGSLVLDESLDTEFFLGIFSSERLSFREIRAAVEAAKAGDGFNLESLRRAQLPGTQHWIVVRKADR